ncbi:branched-chain amino acid ABC transporter permease [Bordetella genomosp. 8]|uniref:branched-chain amino acid ABC transporter permease n=1 Tax=Bordetella genomosp. 8 TaxID=1416806 RepID=UPI001E5E3F7C|nr:branched-chain amino acid ABC transporter permease [Bordetella genomosp. 8]
MKKTVLACLAGTAVLAALPYLLSQGLLNAAIQMLIAALFATAYNLLCGQAGMLSFGHAAYFGVGAFATVHAMNALGGNGLLPTPLMPLAGAFGGLVFGGIAGWFATQRSGTYFAMITLAIAELVHSLAPHLKGTFGGEAGISTMRMPAWGLDFGSTTQVYYLTLAWVLLAMLLLYLYTRTPLGRLTLGLRENNHRLKFLGYNVHGLRTLVFAISAMFAGMAGGLQVLSNESANYVVFDPALSAAAVLNTYIGGVGVFLGPAFGASLMTFFGYAVSDLTRSWLLYQGILFVIVMMFLPRGLAGLFVRRARPAPEAPPTQAATSATPPTPPTPAIPAESAAARGQGRKELA